MILIAPTADAKRNRYIERLIFALRDRDFRFASTTSVVGGLLWWRIFRGAQTVCCTTLVAKLVITLPARVFGMRVIWIEDGLVDRSLTSFRLHLYRTLSRFVTIIVAAHIIMEQLADRGMAKDNIVVIYPGFAIEELGVQSTLFTAVATKRDRRPVGFSIGTVASLDHEKGVEHLLQGLKIANETIPNLHLTIVGNGPKKDSLKWTAKALGIDDHVLFVGWQDKYERWIQGFDLFIMPHVRKDRWSHALLAAMAYKRPIVVTNIGMFPEVIERKQTGVMIEPENPSMIAEAIINLHANPEWRRDMGERAHMRVRDHFSFTQMAEALAEVVR
jgi:glycosyltransferase involved in cell wall biosynthesis